MHIYFVGSGKMGGPMAQRLIERGHSVSIKYHSDHTQETADSIGAKVFRSYSDLPSDAVIWLMIPHQAVTAEIDEIKQHFSDETLVVDGGNSRYTDTLAHAESLSEKGIHFVDVGTSGGIHGLANGYSMMVGGAQQDVDRLSPVLNDLAQPDGWARLGEVGSGHYVKMIHNGVEYGAMQALAEGYRLIREGHFEGIDLASVANVWQHGSINESFLNGLAHQMLQRDSEFTGVTGEVPESGEARWTLETAEHFNIPTPVIKEAFDVRIRSQQGEVNYATKFLAQLRNEFGGHAVPRETDAAD